MSFTSDRRSSGQQIVFQCKRPLWGDGICLMNADGSDLRELTGDAEKDNGFPDWQPLLSNTTFTDPYSQPCCVRVTEQGPGTRAVATADPSTGLMNLNNCPCHKKALDLLSIFDNVI